MINITHYLEDKGTRGKNSSQNDKQKKCVI